MRYARSILIAATAFTAVLSPPAHAWGDQGHRVVGLVADHYLKDSVRQKVKAMLATDSSSFAASKSIADEATWADKFRDSDRNTTKVRYTLTREWHFVDIELSDEDVNVACFSHPPSSAKASDGPAKACIVDRINAFATELADPAATADERLKALQFLLHFVGDVHQPLHASDDHDKGGNDKKAKATSVPTGSLHHYWDTEFVKRLGSNPATIAASLISTTTPGQVTTWSKGNPESWAKQSFELSKLRVYGELGQPDNTGKYALSTGYVTDATKATARQLARAGVRLAKILNDALD